MATHYRLDGLGCLVCVVEWDGANVVVEDVGFNNAVQKSAADEAKLTVNGGCRSTDVIPASSSVVRKSWVGVLEIRDGNLKLSVNITTLNQNNVFLPSQWFTQR